MYNEYNTRMYAVFRSGLFIRTGKILYLFVVFGCPFLLLGFLGIVVVFIKIEVFCDLNLIVARTPCEVFKEWKPSFERIQSFKKNAKINLLTSNNQHFDLKTMI